MPIKGLTELRRFPRLGKIHLGVKKIRPEDKKTGRKETEYPAATDYFVCPPEVQEVFGEKPIQLRIMFPAEDPEKFAPQWYKRWSSMRGLTCKGDGEVCIRLVDKKTGEVAHRDSQDVENREGLPCQGEDCPEYETKACRRVMHLMFLLPEVPGLGVWQIDTSSFYSITAINSGVEMIKGAIPGNRIAMIPLLLSLMPQEVAPNGKKKTVHVLRLDIAVSLAELMQLPPGPVVLSLPQPEVPEPSEAEDLFPAEDVQRGNDGPSGGASPPVTEVASATTHAPDAHPGLRTVSKPPAPAPDALLETAKALGLKVWTEKGTFEAWMNQQTQGKGWDSLDETGKKRLIDHLDRLQTLAAQRQFLAENKTKETK